MSFTEFTPDGKFLYNASRDHMIKFWDANTGNCKNTLKGHEEWVRSVSLNLKGDLLASSSDDEKIFVWQILYNKNYMGIQIKLKVLNF